MATVLLILSTFILVVLLWVLLVPVNLKVDTSLGKYEIYQLGIFRISYCLGNVRLFKLRIFGIPVKMKSVGDITTEPSSGKKKRRKTFTRSFHAWLYLQRGIRRSFLLRRFQCTIDTEDPVLNAQLYPVLIFVSGGRANITVNFVGENYLTLEIQARVYRLCWTIVRFLTKK